MCYVVTHRCYNPKEKVGCGGWAFSSNARGKCVVSAAQTQAHTPVAVPIQIRIASPGATFLMLPARAAPTVLPLAAGASRVPVATCRGRLAREARLAARDPRAARRRGTARAPDARRCS